MSPESAVAARPRLFAALEAAFPVRFGPHAPGSAPDALVVLRPPSSPPLPVPAEVPTLVFEEAGGAGPVALDVELFPRAAVDRRLHNITLPRQRASAPLRVPATGEEVLAADRSGARWTQWSGSVPAQRVAATLPELAPTEILRDPLLSDRSLPLIALVQFLRSVSADCDWRPPPLRATLLFDDPNLRRRSYGFIDFRRLVEHADTHGYHAVMAMVPAAASRAHPDTASLFRERPNRLSLVLHGNNHVKRELMAPVDAQSALALCAQALRRIAAFEARHDLHVDRVMTPPHGLCSPHVASALSALGFDGLCAIHPHPWSERPPAERLLAGWHSATFVDACPVIPRFPLNCSATEIALRAFMDHPLVLYGHHGDVADGLDALADVVARVNGLGEVEWMSLGAIARSNYGLRMRGGTAQIRPFAGRIEAPLPDEADAVAVKQPSDSNEALAGWSLADGDPVLEFGAPVRRSPTGVVDIRLQAHNAVDPGHVPAPAWSPWPPLRRAATEMRDRALPLRSAGVLPRHGAGAGRRDPSRALAGRTEPGCRPLEGE